MIFHPCNKLFSILEPWYRDKKVPVGLISVMRIYIMYEIMGESFHLVFFT